MVISMYSRAAAVLHVHGQTAPLTDGDRGDDSGDLGRAAGVLVVREVEEGGVK